MFCPEYYLKWPPPPPQVLLSVQAVSDLHLSVGAVGVDVGPILVSLHAFYFINATSIWEIITPKLGTLVLKKGF